ncbi:MAG TPA: guanylate kinase, partial [Saprospiraceae bacterium]|nr:guanylate kinase [Saprospiraceae bacterium]
IEWEEVYENQFYGTLKSEVDRISKLGKYIIFDVEVKGATSIKQFYGDEALVVFIRPPSLEVLIERLKNRKTETTKSLKKRIKRAKEELKYENNFDMILVNDILEVTLKEAELIVEDFLHIQEKENEASL